MECPTDIIIEIIKYLEIDELFELVTLCNTSYKFLYKKLLAIKSITIAIYAESNLIVIGDFRSSFPRLKILNKFLNLKKVIVVINNNNPSKLNRVIKCLPKGIKKLHLLTWANDFKWNRLFKFKELTHLYVDYNILGKSYENKIIEVLKNTKLYYLYISNYDWIDADYLFIISKNTPDMKAMIDHIDKGRQQFVGAIV